MEFFIKPVGKSLINGLVVKGGNLLAQNFNHFIGFKTLFLPPLFSFTCDASDMVVLFSESAPDGINERVVDQW